MTRLSAWFCRHAHLEATTNGTESIERAFKTEALAESIDRQAQMVARQMERKTVSVREDVADALANSTPPKFPWIREGKVTWHER